MSEVNLAALVEEIRTEARDMTEDGEDASVIRGWANTIAAHLRKATPPAAPDEAMVLDAWQDKPDDKGWFWHFDGEEMRPLFVFPRPGHQYLAVQEEPNPVTGKRQFRMADRIGGKWLAIPVPKQPALTAALTGDKA